MERIVVDLNNYSGNTQTALKNGKCIYSGKPESYYIDKGFSIVTYEELKPIHEKFLNKLCGDWEEITAEKYEKMADILPPARWSNGGFFVPEMWIDDVAGFYQKWQGKFYYSLQRLTYNRKDILDSLQKFINRKGDKTMDYTEKMNRCWAFIRDQQITDDSEEFKENAGMILVENISEVREAYEKYLDKKEELLEKGWDKDEAEFEAFGFECVFEWLDSHGIKWEIKEKEWEGA